MEGPIEVLGCRDGRELGLVWDREKSARRRCDAVSISCARREDDAHEFCAAAA